MKKFFSRSKAHDPQLSSKDRQLDTSPTQKSTAKVGPNEGRLEPLCFSNIPWDLDTQSSQQRAVPARVAGSSLPPAVSPSERSPVEELGSIYTLEHPDARASTSTLSHGHAPKMVVFAPSPEKQRTRPPQVSLSDEARPAPYAMSNGSSSSFARPTKASQARARPVARASVGDQPAYSRPDRPGSLATSSRRSYSYTTTPSHGDAHTLSIPGRSSDAFSGRLSLDNHGISPSIRSSSPLNFPRRTSAPMQATGSSSSGRRSSLLPPFSVNDAEDAVTFPATGNAPRSFGFPTWSEMTQQDLVRNLGPRERTRQEVLWEIVASEERYVLELEKARELYIDALLRPHAFDAAWQTSPPQKTSPVAPQDASGSELPIAARYMANSEESSPSIGHEATAKSTASPAIRSDTAVGSTARSGPNYGLGLGLGTTPLRNRSMNASAPSLSPTAKLKPRPRLPADTEAMRLAVPLPPSLHEVLSAMGTGLLEAHTTLSEALKARYEAQWPLVRSLADVFMQHAHMLAHYGSYVCHLQRAMGELEEAALMERAFRGKKLRKERLSATVGLGRTVSALEQRAADHGCAGLALFISTPFQRLLKYPLLFQNLLYHTDPSTHEFESTVAMVVEVERLVRSIEDEKVSVEERDRTRDAFARIDGVTNKQVLRPKADRVLVEERAVYDEAARRAVSDAGPKEPPDVHYASDSDATSERKGLRATLRGKRSYRRLSDFLEPTTAGKHPSLGSKKDLWIVRFSDMELKCQRIGVTALPISSTAIAGTGDTAADFAARSKDSRLRLKALRSTTLRAPTRNLYRFVAVTAWRSAVPTDTAVAPTPEITEEDEPSEDERSSEYSSGSSAKSSDEAAEPYVRSTKLSFTYWGDRIEPNAAHRADAQQQPRAAGVRTASAMTMDGMAATSITSASESMQNVVAQMHARPRNDKFGARLRPSLAPTSSLSIPLTNDAP